jgi:hypothetical protein
MSITQPQLLEVTRTDGNLQNKIKPKPDEIAKLDLLLKEKVSFEEKRALFLAWYKELFESRVKFEKGVKRRQEEIDTDRQNAETWVDYLDDTLDFLKTNTIYVQQASSEYGVSPNTISTWKTRYNILEPVAARKNKLWFNEKELALALVIRQKFAVIGTNIVPHALRYYLEKQKPEHPN